MHWNQYKDKPVWNKRVVQLLVFQMYNSRLVTTRFIHVIFHSPPDLTDNYKSTIRWDDTVTERHLYCDARFHGSRKWICYRQLACSRWPVFTARCSKLTVQSTVLLSHVVCPSASVTLVDHDHIGGKPWKLIARTINPTSSLFVAKRSSTYSQGDMEKFWGD